MAFSNVSSPINSFAPTNAGAAPTTGGRAALGLMRDADAARVGYTFTPFKASSATGLYVYELPGVNYFSLILYGTIGTTSITLWGSQSNMPGSWVAIGSAISAVGETVITSKFYRYFAISVDTIGGPLSLDVLAIRA